MKILNRSLRSVEADALRRLFLQTEQRLVDIITSKQARGYVDYAEQAILQRTQAELRKMMAQAGVYVPKAVQRYFYLGIKQGAAKGYRSAEDFLKNASPLQMRAMEILINNLTGVIAEAAVTAQRTIQAGLSGQLIGRAENDIFRWRGLQAVAEARAGTGRPADMFINMIKRDGITAFVDKVGRRWSLDAYCNMAARTTNIQALNVGTIYADEEQDLYQMSRHGTTCKICARYEGRVFSRSGMNPNYPSLASCYGKIDPNGPEVLENSYLNIHPNCLHRLVPWTESGKSPEEIKKARRFSSYTTNPPVGDSRSEREIEAYRAKEQGRQKLMNDWRQYNRYKQAGAVEVSFQTFQKHKLKDDERYHDYMEAYRNRDQAEK